MTYHIYQHNLNELSGAIKFAQEHNIDFNPYYAHVIDYWKIKSYTDKTISQELLDDINTSVFVSHIRNGLSDVPKGYRCPQENVLNIDENGKIIACCVLPNNHPEYSFGNILDENAVELIISRQEIDECNYCKNSGISKLLTTYEGTPAYVRELEQYIKNEKKFLELKEKCKKPKGLFKRLFNNRG